MDMRDDLMRYANELIQDLEEQIAREEAAMTEEEKEAEKMYQKEFTDKMMRLAEKEMHRFRTVL